MCCTFYIKTLNFTQFAVGVGVGVGVGEALCTAVYHELNSTALKYTALT